MWRSRFTVPFIGKTALFPLNDAATVAPNQPSLNVWVYLGVFDFNYRSHLFSPHQAFLSMSCYVQLFIQLRISYTSFAFAISTRSGVCFATIVNHKSSLDTQKCLCTCPDLWILKDLMLLKCQYYQYHQNSLQRQA